jgi:hypothetical protein
LSLQDQPPKLLNGNWPQWAMRVSAWLATTRSTLRFRVTGESAADNGVLLWDTNGYPVVSYNGEFVGIALTSGFTVATLPTGTTGQRAYVTDATTPTFGAAVSGGGAVVIPVFKNATAWIVG